MCARRNCQSIEENRGKQLSSGLGKLPVSIGRIGLLFELTQPAKTDHHEIIVHWIKLDKTLQFPSEEKERKKRTKDLLLQDQSK